MMRIAFGLCLLALASSAWPQLAVGTWNKRGDRPTLLMIIEPAGGATKITYKVLTPDGKPLPQADMTLVTHLDGNEVPVLVNGKRVSLRGVRARGRSKRHERLFVSVPWWRQTCHSQSPRRPTSGHGRLRS